MSKIKMVTPAGLVKFPKLDNPDEKGKRTICLTLDPNEPEVAKFINDFNEKKQETKFPNYNKTFKPDKRKNQDTGELEETGLVLMNFISYFPVKFFDAKRNEVENPEVGWGSKVKIAFLLTEFEADANKGLTKYILGIQILDLKGGVTAEGCGFEDEEGYQAGDKGSEVLDPDTPLDQAEVPWE